MSADLYNHVERQIDLIMTLEELTSREEAAALYLEQCLDRVACVLTRYPEITPRRPSSIRDIAVRRLQFKEPGSEGA